MIRAVVEAVLGCFIRLVRMFLQSKATSVICRLVAAAMIWFRLCFPGGSFPVYTMSSRQEKSSVEITAGSMKMLSDPSRTDLGEGGVKNKLYQR